MRTVVGILFGLIVLLPYATMVGTGRGRTEPAPGRVETVRIVSPHRREVRLEYSRGFADWMRKQAGRNVRIEWLDVGGTSKILKDLESRFASQPSSAGVDLLFGGGVAPYYTAIEHGWLEQTDLPAALLDGIPAQCAGSPVYDSGRRWFGVALSGFGILYNRPLIERLGLKIPGDWEDLGQPEYFSWVASGDPRSSGSVHMCYEIILQAYGFEKGWALLARLCANVRRFGESGGNAPQEVASGEVAAGMVIDQYAQTVIDSVGGDVLRLVLPRGTTVIGADSIGRLRGAPEPELARLFIEYALSEEGQRLLFQPAGVNGQRHSLRRMPVRRALYADAQAPATRPFEHPGGMQYDEKKGSFRWNIVNDLVGAWLIGPHGELAAAWSAVIRGGLNERLVERLCALPVQEDELPELVAAWKDPRRKMETIDRWAQAARARYRDIARDAAAGGRARERAE